MSLYQFVSRHKISKAFFISFCAIIAVVLYFLSCAIFGKKGIFTYFALKEEIARQDFTKQKLAREIDVKKNMVDGMNVESLDLDLLDEEARRSLGYSNKNEIVIYQDKNKRKNEQ